MIITFGGAFNPPTIAHYEIAKHLIKSLPCEQFFYLPVGDLYPKKGLTCGSHRINMLNLVCDQLEGASVCAIEVNASRVLTTFETLTILQKKHPQSSIAFVMGADNLNDLAKWQQFAELIKNFKLIIFKRDDLNIEKIIETNFKPYEQQFILMEAFGELHVSSTLYREHLMREDLVLTSVSQYIKTHQLYGR